MNIPQILDDYSFSTNDERFSSMEEYPDISDDYPDEDLIEISNYIMKDYCTGEGYL